MVHVTCRRAGRTPGFFALATLMLAWCVLMPRHPVHAEDLLDVLTEYTVTSWGQRDGLPPGAVWSTAQDRDGYLWIGTDAGLYRFDGVHFVRWTPLGSPAPVMSIRAALVSRDGSVWIGHGETGGISRIQQNTARTFGEQDGLPPGVVTSIVENGQRMLAANSQGLFALNGDRWEKVEGLPDGAVFSGYISAKGELAVGTASGIYRRSADNRPFELLPSHDEGLARSVSEDAQGRIYVTDGIVGFRSVNASRSPAVAVSQRGRGYRLLHDRRGHLWVGTLGQGLWRISVQQQARGSGFDRLTRITGLASDGVLSIMEDREGNIWLGTSEGLSRLVPRRITQITNLGLVSGVDANRDGSIWVGTVDEVLRFSESNLQTPLERLPLRATRLRTMHAHGDTLWAATDDYVATVPPGGSRLRPLGPEVLLKQVDLMTTDAGGSLWLHDDEVGLRRLVGGRMKPVALPPSFDARRLVEMHTRALRTCCS